MGNNYFLIAWRNLLRNKVYSFINIAGLSIGLACCMLILLYNKDEVSYDRFHDNASNIYRITSTSISTDGKVERTDGVTGMMPGPTFKQEVPEVKEFVRLQGEQLTVKVGKEVFDQQATYVDDNFFDIFSFPLKEGNKKEALKNLYSVVVNEELANKFFGTTAAMGKIIELPTGDNGAFESFTIAGIVPKSPQNSSIKIQLLLPMKLNLRAGREDKNWINFYLNTFVVLHPAADIKKVEENFQRAYESNAMEEIRMVREKYNVTSSFKYGLQPLLQLHLSTDFSAANGLTDASKPIFTKILGGIALFMLVIACINFVNLTVARSIKRAKEIGVRKVIGSDRRQLIIQFLGESFLLSFFAFVFAILLVILCLPLFNSLANKALSFSYLLDFKLVLGYITLFFITSLLAGFYPALILSGFSPVQTLYNRMPLSGRNYLSRALVVLQFTLTTFLIIATITIYAQFNYLTSYNLGYNDKNLVIVAANGMKMEEVQVFRQELMKNTAVDAVAVRQGGVRKTIAKVDGNQIDFAFEYIDSAYFPALEIPVVRGRNFSAAFPSDSTTAVVVNESFMKKARWKDLNNRQVDFFYDSIKYNVIGVVKDYHYESLAEEIKPQLFVMNPMYQYGQLLIKIKPAATSTTLKYIETIFKSRQPFVPFNYEFKDVSNARQYDAEQKWKQIISFAAILTIFISCIGLFGLATMAAEKRTKEIGIRKVLGASVTTIVSSLSNSFLKLIMIAAAIAIPAAWWVMHRWLQNYPYRIEMGALVFVIAIFMIVAVALFTISFQTIKVAIANPIKSLRAD